FAIGVATVAVVWRPWPAAIGLAVAAAAAWMVAGAPAVERALASRDSLRPFARAVAARYPGGARVAFYGRPVRPVVVYLGRHVPTLAGRAEAITPGLAVIVTEEEYRRLAADHILGAPLLSAIGRIGNRGRGWMMLAEAAPSRLSRPLDMSPGPRSYWAAASSRTPCPRGAEPLRSTPDAGRATIRDRCGISRRTSQEIANYGRAAH